MIQHSLFDGQPSRAMRLWHWCTAIIVLLLFYSVFVGKFSLNVFQNGMIIHDMLGRQGLLKGKDPSGAIAEALGHGIWDWHVRYGYVLTGLFVFRVAFEWLQRPEQRLDHGVRTAFALRTQVVSRGTAGHYLVVRLLYFLFYVVLAMIVTTGLWLAFNRSSTDFATVHAVKKVHGFGFYFLLLFVLVHVIGVIRAERKKPYRNFVSRMIHGAK